MCVRVRAAGKGLEGMTDGQSGRLYVHYYRCCTDFDADIANSDLIANIVREAGRPFPRRPVRLLEIKNLTFSGDRNCPSCSGIGEGPLPMLHRVSVPRFGGLWRLSFEQFERWAHTLTTMTLRPRTATATTMQSVSSD